MLLSITLFGPLFGLALMSVYLARLRFAETRMLFELTEPMLALFAAILAIAISGILVQVIG